MDINRLMHEGMRERAEELAQWAIETSQSVSGSNPDLNEREVFRKMLDGRVKFPGGDAAREKVLDRYGTSLHGLCYYLGLNAEDMRELMISRCLQFVEYIDIALANRGALPLPDERKRKYFETLGLPQDAVGKSHL